MRCEHCFETLPTQQPNANPAENAAQNAQYQQNAGGYQQNAAPFPANQPSYQNPFAQSGPVCPKDYLVLNIIFGILSACGCMGFITGTIGIIFAAQVKSKFNKGDYAGAQSASTVAKIMFIINLVFSILAVAYWIFSFVLAFTGYGNSILNEIYNSYYFAALKFF